MLSSFTKSDNTPPIYILSYIMSFWSSATEPKRDSWSKCQETSSTTAVWPVKMVLASRVFPSFGLALMSHRQIVWREKTGSKILKNEIKKITYWYSNQLLTKKKSCYHQMKLHTVTSSRLMFPVGIAQAG